MIITVHGQDPIEFSADHCDSLRDVVRALGLPPEGLLAFVKDEPVPLDSKPGEEVLFVLVASGG